MIDKSFVDKIVDLTSKGSESVVEKYGLTYKPTHFSPIEPPKQNPIVFQNLEGLIDFVAHQAPKVKVFLHVKNHQEVFVLNRELEDDKSRTCIAEACLHKVVGRFPFGDWLHVENFYQYFVSHFEQTDTMIKLLETISNIKTENSSDIEDNGFTQSVSSKTGVTLANLISLPNPVPLKPFETFPEVQDSIMPKNYVFRVKEGSDGKPLLKIVKVDNMSWQLDCVVKIKDYLDSQFDGYLVV